MSVETVEGQQGSRVQSQGSRDSGAVRVLHVVSGLFYGGGQRVVADLLRALPRAGAGAFDCRLWTLGEGETPLTRMAGGSVAYDGRYNSPATLWGGSRELRRVLREQRIDILHTHGLDADLIGGLAVRGSKVRQVCHLHVSPPAAGTPESWKAGVRRRLFRWLTGRRETRFIAVSEAVRQGMGGYYGIDPGRIRTVLNGVDVDEFGKADEGMRRGGEGERKRLVIGTAGRLEGMKGFEFLVEAAGLLASRGVEFEVRIAGKGSKRAELEAQAAELGVGERVRFVGHVSDMPEFYRGLDVFVLPSVSTEGLPLVVLESMAMGTPVVATRLAGAPEVIDDGETGLLAPPGDAEALADALGRLAGDEELRKELGAAGAAHVRERFTVERVAREVVEVYCAVMAEG